MVGCRGNGSVHISTHSLLPQTRSIKCNTTGRWRSYEWISVMTERPGRFLLFVRRTSIPESQTKRVVFVPGKKVRCG